MFLTLFYMYATLIQWWRLGQLKNKLNGTLNSQNALLLCNGCVINEANRQRSLENLLFRNEDRIGCTIVPKQKINLCQWVVFPRDPRYFPILFKEHSQILVSPYIYILVQAVLETYTKHESEIIKIENFGDLIAWKSTENFEVILKTDIDKLTKLVQCFQYNSIDINHELKLLRIETVDVEGHPARIKYERAYSMESTLKYSYAPVYWKKFVSEVKDLYSKVKDVTPKITIENGSAKSDTESRKVPVSEVKPIKKEAKKSEDKHKLEVGSSEYRRHKSSDHKREKSATDKHKTEKEPKGKDELNKTKEAKPEKHKIDKKDSKTEALDGKLEKHKAIDHKRDDRDQTMVKEHHRDKRTKEETQISSTKTENIKTDKEEKMIEEPKTNVTKPTEVSKEDVKLEAKLEENKTSKSSSKDIKVKEEHKHKVKTDKHKVDKEHKADSAVQEQISSSVKPNNETKFKREPDVMKTEAKHVLKSHDDRSGKHPSGTSKETKSRSEILKEKISRHSKSPEKHNKASASTTKAVGDDNVKKGIDKKDSKTRDKSSEKSAKKIKAKSSSKEEKIRKLSTDTFALAVEIPDSGVSESLASDDKYVGPLNGGVVGKNAKPPNVLVYADSVVAKDNVKAVLQTMLNKERYTIYDLPVNMSAPNWNNSTALVVVCGIVPENLTSQLLHYLLNGGQLLCLCSDLLYSVLHNFTTAEVREHELVRFTYGEWKQVRMMHHIFCYQASPAKKQFSKDSDHSNPSSGNGSSPIAPRTPSAVVIQNNGKDYTIQVQVLGAEETWQTPSLLLATVKGSEGKAIFSQVHLEINPNEYEDDESKYEALRESNQARLEILKDILSNRLDMDCSEGVDSSYTAAYFLGRHDLKLKMLSDCESIKNNTVNCDNVTMTFYGKDVKFDTPTSNALPVLIHSCPSNFSTVNYFETLNTKDVGRLVIYSDVLNSSQYLLSKPLSHGLVVIPKQQTSGIGRSKNIWLSPVGSASFSLQLHFPLDTPLGRAVPLVQHLIMVAIVDAIKDYNGCQELNLGIKWPNDLYADGNSKIGGLIANSTIKSNMVVVNVGAGVNLSNSNPTTCINDLIQAYNLKNSTKIKPISYEVYFGLVFNKIEEIFNRVQEKEDLKFFYDLYYKYWLHGDSSVLISSPDGSSKKVKIIGIDDFGFLKVEAENGKITAVQPDGNSFDMMKGLIAPKLF